MKITIYILTWYMLALSLLPCGDGGGGLVGIANSFFEIEHHDDSDHEQHSNSCGDDHCSPFCICSCCSSTLDYPAKWTLTIAAPTPKPSAEPSFVHPLLFSTLTSSVWQPPQFC